MSYSNFTLGDLKDKFQLKFTEDEPLFSAVPDYEVPLELTAILREFYTPGISH